MQVPGSTPATATPSPTITLTPTAAATSSPTATPTLPVIDLQGHTLLVFPNPASGRVRFAYALTGPARVEIDLYHVSGERVAHVVEQKDGGSGQTLTTTWEALGAAPGIYLARILIKRPDGQVLLDQKKKVALIR
jgi:hypothetical protein